jgi:hypothetical protein
LPTLLMLYPAYGTVSVHEVCRHAESVGEMRTVLADDAPTTSDLDIFDEVWELPPPENVEDAYQAMRRWCAKDRPDGLFLQSERGILLGSLLIREFGLKGPTVEAAHLCSNKYAQRVALQKAGIGVPYFRLVDSAEEVRRFIREFGFPVVLKCVISTMSRLVTLVSKADQMEPSVARMREALTKSLDVKRLASFARAGNVDLGCDPSREFLVESFLTGDMIETDGFVVGRKPFTFGVTEQIQSVDPPFFIESYLLPAECTDNADAERVSDATIAAMGLSDSAFSIEMRAKDGVVSIVEVNGRLGWDEGFSDLFAVRTHEERIVQAQQLALGLDLRLERDVSRCAALAYRPCYYDGIVEQLPTREYLRSLSTAGLRLGLATNRGARFVAPPNPETYPHVAWALATHPTSSRRANDIARNALAGLEISIRHL